MQATKLNQLDIDCFLKKMCREKRNKNGTSTLKNTQENNTILEKRRTTTI